MTIGSFLECLKNRTDWFNWLKYNPRLNHIDLGLNCSWVAIFHVARLMYIHSADLVDIENLDVL